MTYIYHNGTQDRELETGSSYSMARMSTLSSKPFYVGIGTTVKLYVYVNSITNGTLKIGYNDTKIRPSTDYVMDVMGSKTLSVGWNTYTFTYNGEDAYIHASVYFTSNVYSADSSNTVTFGSSSVTFKTAQGSAVISVLGYDT